MKGFASILIIAVILGIMSSDSLAAEETTITVEGIRIVSQGYTGQEDMRAFSWTEGTTLCLLVFREKGGIVDFRKDDSQLEVMTDDKGTDLTKTERKSTWSASAGFGGFPKKSDDGKAILLEVTAPSVPAPDAAAVTLKGKIVLSVGKETKTTENKDTPITIDSKVKAGDMEFEISSVGKPSWGDAKLCVTFNGKGDSSVIKDIQFFDESGKEVEAERSMTSSWGDSFQWQYNLSEKVNSANIKVITWTDLRNVAVPFEIKAGIGVGK
jgi:hypothetical protein